MTKRNILSGVAAAALLLTPLALCAQGLRWDARAGAAIPAGDLADAVDPGFSFGLGLGIPLNDQIYLRLDGDGNFLSEISDDELDEEIEQFFEGGLNLWHYGAGLEFDFVDADETGVRLSAGLGGGLTTIDPDEPETDVPGVGASEATTRFTANGGLTLGVKPTEMFAVFVRGRAFVIFMDEDVYDSSTFLNLPIQLGIQIGG